MLHHGRRDVYSNVYKPAFMCAVRVFVCTRASSVPISAAFKTLPIFQRRGARFRVKFTWFDLIKYDSIVRVPSSVYSHVG